MQGSGQGKRYAPASPERDLHPNDYIPVLGTSIRKRPKCLKVEG